LLGRNNSAGEMSIQGRASANAEPGMCHKCKVLDKKMERYRRLAASINDPLTIDRINQLIEETETEKAKLHPEQDPSAIGG
jgi:hypothetical protein